MTNHVEVTTWPILSHASQDIAWEEDFLKFGKGRSTWALERPNSSELPFSAPHRHLHVEPPGQTEMWSAVSQPQHPRTEQRRVGAEAGRPERCIQNRRAATRYVSEPIPQFCDLKSGSASVSAFVHWKENTGLHGSFTLVVSSTILSKTRIYKTPKNKLLWLDLVPTQGPSPCFPHPPWGPSSEPHSPTPHDRFLNNTLS